MRSSYLCSFICTSYRNILCKFFWIFLLNSS
nr:MAG TPA: hypothetical protein [Caudoviricetes sp.]DAJ18212.1 MAG TPA: hypothetical protein [Podoviridae sp. ctY3D12]